MSAIETLRSLGFTDLEAKLYCALLARAPASGYRLAKDIGKAQANVYNALESLLRKGAIVTSEGSSREFTPVPPAELIGMLGRGFQSQLKQAEAELGKLEVTQGSEGMYHLFNTDQVFERAIGIIARAQEIILFDFFPGPWSALHRNLEEAAARGVRVAGLVYQNLSPAPLFDTLALTTNPELIARWPGQQLTVVADASEHLMALLSHDGETVLRAVASDSPYLSCMQHNGLASEIRIFDASPADTDRFASLSLLHAAPPGLYKLVSSENVIALRAA